MSLIIPHLRGQEILQDCLNSIFRSTFQNFEIILIDNASEDGSAEMVAQEFPTVRQIRSEVNQGYAGGCNVGIVASRAEYVILLNDDTILEPNTIGLLVEALDCDPELGGAQPKLLNINERTHFDYSGACGGLMDIFGYPFAFGRTFMSLEEDNGQYDKPSDIFWACGTCVIFRRLALAEVGLLDQDFFVHMEEIDLAWRLQLWGYRLIRVPQAVVYHYSGHTLPNTQRQKMFLNHRNSIICLLKNYSLVQLAWILPIRIVLEWGIIAVSFLRRDFRRGPAALSVQLRLPLLIFQNMGKRRLVQKNRRISDRQVMKQMYRGSIVLQHFLLGRRETAQILHQNEL
ncbi:MAG: glycosyltransferase family 2 protein [bacterium]|nr:glycosyltransferase family 2 protein [bacterium]